MGRSSLSDGALTKMEEVWAEWSTSKVQGPGWTELLGWQFNGLLTCRILKNIGLNPPSVCRDYPSVNQNFPVNLLR